MVEEAEVGGTNLTRTWTVPGYRFVSVSAMSLVAALFLWQALHGIPYAYVPGGLAALLAVRGSRGRVRLTPSHLEIRSWAWSSRVPIHRIQGVGILPYSGVWAKGGAIFFLDELALKMDDREVRRVPPIVGPSRGGKVEKVAHELAEGIGVGSLDLLKD